MKRGEAMGRQRIEIDKKTFENLCGIQCTLEEIAGVFECSEDTVERWCKRTYRATFADTYKKHSMKGKISLRRSQFRLAEKNASMAIFLGKNYLGQRDVIEQQINTEETSKVLSDIAEKIEKIREQGNAEAEENTTENTTEDAG